MFIPVFLAGGAIVTGIVRFYKPRQPKMPISQFAKSESRTWGNIDEHEEPLADQERRAESLSKQGSVSRHFALSLGVTALSAVGSLGYPVLLFWSLPGLLYFNIYFLRRGYSEIKKEKRLGIASTDATVVTGTFLLRSFFPSALFISLYFLSEKLLQVAEHSTEHDLAALMADLPEVVWLSKSIGSEPRTQVEVQVALAGLNVEDIIVVHAGEMVPVDGIVTVGEAQVMCHPLLGRRGTLSVGDKVLASTVVQSGTIWVQVREVGENTQLAQAYHSFKQHLSKGQTYESQAWVDRGVLPMFVLSIGTIPFKGVQSGISVLLTYFGYDLRVVAPIGTLNFMKIALQEGIVIRDGRALEALYAIDTVLFFCTDPADGVLLYELPQQSANSSFGSANSFDMQLKQQSARTIGATPGDNLLEQFAEQDQVKYYSAHECQNILADLHRAGRSICMINADEPMLAMMEDGDISIAIGNIEGVQVHSAQIYIPDGYIEQLIRLFELGNAQHANLRASLWAIAIPSFFCLGGIYFLHFGVLTSIIVDYLGLVAGVANATLLSAKYGLQNNIKN